MSYRNRLVRRLAGIALLAVILGGLAGRFDSTARAQEMSLPALVDPSREGVVVISEFRTRGPSGERDEFIELHNRGSMPAHLSQWSVRISGALGSNLQLLELPYGTSLQPGQRYLLAGPAYSGAAAPDRTWSVSPVLDISDWGGIAVLNGSRGIIDQVGMSSRAAYVEGSPLRSMTDDLDQSYERRLGGIQDSCQDGDDNSLDFVLIHPAAPQNASTPISLCGIGLQDTSINLDYDIPDPSEFRQIVNVYYHVIASSGTPPGGWVVKVSGNNSYGCEGWLNNGQGGCSMLSGAPGLDSLVASYSGYGIYRASTSVPEPHQAEKADTITRVTWDDPDPSFQGRPLLIRVSVTGIHSALGSPSGAVIVRGGERTCTITLRYGVGACPLTFTGVGRKKITASYSGDANYSPSISQAEVHRVVLAPTRTPTSTPAAPMTAVRVTPNRTATAWTATARPTITPTARSGCPPSSASTRPLTSLNEAPLPDLSVRGVGIRLEHLSCELPGQYRGIGVGIANLGQASAERFVVSMDNEEQVVDGLDAGSVTGLIFRHWPGNYVCVMLDTTGAVEESDETNNQFGQWLPMPTQGLPCIAPSLTPTLLP